VAPTRARVAVAAPKSTLKIEAVSNRLKGELIHPNRNSVLEGIRFSPDGRRLMAGDYPGGVVVVWDVESGKQLTTIETGYGSRSSADYFFPTPDWRELFVARAGKRKYERVELNGKRMTRWTFDGDVRMWDLGSGRLDRRYQHREPRSMIGGMQLSPDATTFVTFEELPGTYEHRAKRAASAWDVKTGQYRALPDGLQSYGRFSPNGHDLAIASVDADGYTRALKLIDVATAREKLSIPIRDKYVWAHIAAFSPDARLMAGDYRCFEHAQKYENSQSYSKWWETSTGREVASFAADKNTSFAWPRFSPDGQTIAVANWRDERAKLFLFDVRQKQLRRTVLLGDKPMGEKAFVMEPAFRPDGKQIAVISQLFPESGGGEMDARDVAQARIFLIDPASGTIQETLVAPQGFPSSACFSPDGRTLATGGEGRVLLWDVASEARSVGRAPDRP
jgi:WD40 repeat protein